VLAIESSLSKALTGSFEVSAATLRHPVWQSPEIRENALADGVCKITGLGFTSSSDFNLLSLFDGQALLAAVFNHLKSTY
jgi:hypothetical protein